ncbi:hypothetical protein BH11GEM2_BH11GEM2_23680 [soil metagenome]|jgi:hypothetical protein
MTDDVQPSAAHSRAMIDHMLAQDALSVALFRGTVYRTQRMHDLTSRESK